MRSLVSALRSIVLNPLLYIVLLVAGVVRVSMEPSTTTFGLVAGMVALAFGLLSVIAFRRRAPAGAVPTAGAAVRSLTGWAQAVACASGMVLGMLMLFAVGARGAIVGGLLTAAMASLLPTLVPARSAQQAGPDDGPIWAHAVSLGLIVGAVLGFFAYGLTIE
jgi:hypothetical protein